MVFKLLSKQEHVMKVRCFDDALQAHGCYDIKVQPYERWRPGRNEIEQPPLELEVFLVDNSAHSLDIVRLIENSRKLKNLKIWQRGPSDVEGCINLYNGSVVQWLIQFEQPQLSDCACLKCAFG